MAPAPVLESTGTTGWNEPARDRPLEVLDQQRAVDLLAADVALHQGLVLGLLDHALDQGAALLVVRVVVR